MDKLFTVLGLMSGTSSDGIDASIIKTDGINKYESLNDLYFKYSYGFMNSFQDLKERIKCEKDLLNLRDQIDSLDREYTLINAKIVNDIIKNININIELVGFHGQTIYHNSEKKISKQIGNAALL